MVSKIIRFVLSVLLVYGVYTETGTWTSVSIALLIVSIELISISIKKIQQ